MISPALLWVAEATAPQQRQAKNKSVRNCSIRAYKVRHSAGGERRRCTGNCGRSPLLPLVKASTQALPVDGYLRALHRPTDDEPLEKLPSGRRARHPRGTGRHRPTAQPGPGTQRPPVPHRTAPSRQPTRRVRRQRPFGIGPSGEESGDARAAGESPPCG